MNQFCEFLGFELRLRFKSPSTYVYFLMWLAFGFLCVGSEGFSPVSRDSGKVLLNGPYAITLTCMMGCAYGIIVMAAIFGTSILRDFQRDTHQILFTKPISRLAYLGGRWGGSYLATLFTFVGLPLGIWLGTFAPWADHARVAPNHLWWYVQPFLSIVAVQVFFLGALFFAVAALTRKLFVVYVQGVALFVLYLIGATVFLSTRSTEHFWSGILDPVGMLLDNVIVRYWSVAERNTLLFPWDASSGYSPGVFLYNRLLWIGVGAASLGLLWALFPLSVESLTAKAQGRRAAKLRKQNEEQMRAPRSQIAATLPKVHPVHGWTTTWWQFLSLAKLRINGILRSVPFWALAGLLVAFVVNNGYFAGRRSGSDVWPLTVLMLEAVEGNAFLFFCIVAALYAAELVWRERDERFNGIHDALPLAALPDWLSKLVAIVVVELALLALTLLVSMLMQTVLGYHHYEPLQYFEELYLIVFPQVLGFALLALFVQTVVPNKFLGHAIVIGVWVLVPILYRFGIENTLLLPGMVPKYIYSDMNGYGFYVQPIFWSIAYWTGVFAFLGVLSLVLARRGAEIGLVLRAKLAWKRVVHWAPAALVCLLVASGAGGWFYYNTRVLNEFLSSEQRRAIQADYERKFKQYEHVPLPKVTAVDVNVEIYPDKRAFAATGRYALENKTDAPIKELHFTDTLQAVRELKFDRPAHLVSKAPRGLYAIYALDSPLQPGETMKLDFKVGHDSPGFKDGAISDLFDYGDQDGRFAYNGTFFDSGYFPQLGYDPSYELDDPRRRREQHLGAKEEMLPRGDAQGSRANLFSPQSDWITFHAVVGTSGDQLAIAPGYLQKQWQVNGRNYYEYDMGKQPIQDFFAFVSARYAAKKEVYQGVAGPISVELYYQPGHTYALDAMRAASRDGLAYYEQHYSPFQFRQYRVLETPRYRAFAQSFPNTVPYTELGFIQRRRRDSDVDRSYFVTAHELGHQWWGHQLIGGNVQGSNMMSETLAEYSALMVLKHKYGADSEQMRTTLRREELDGYLRGRVAEQNKERPLALVQNEAYVWYNKGGLVMYALADYAGEDNIDQALHEFLMKYRYANSGNGLDGAYPDTRQLIEALRSHVPSDLQYLIDDSFNRIVLYDNRAISATSKKRADGKYEVTLDVRAGKAQVDGEGNEKPMPLADYIDIGVFEGEKDKEKPLLVRRVKFTESHRSFTLIVDRAPTRAGIDPYNKLIDRIADDNLIDVTRKD